MHCDMHANSSPNLIILLSPSRDYNMSLCSLYCAYCALKALVDKPTKTEIVWNYVHCSKQKVQKLQIAYFCGFLRIFADYLRTFAFFFAYMLFVVWSIWGSKHCNVYNTTEKLHVFLSLGAGRWDHAWIVGRMSRNNIFCVCICSKKLQNMLVSLIHGTEFIDLTLNVVPQAILITHV